MTTTLFTLARLLAAGTNQDTIRLEVGRMASEETLAAEIFGRRPSTDEWFAARNALWEGTPEAVKRLIAVRLPGWGWQIESPRFGDGMGAYRAELRGNGYRGEPHFASSEYAALLLAFIGAVRALQTIAGDG